jgi:DNA-binding response OmpR family regulator
VVITDLMMPRMPGDALIAAVRDEQGVNPSIVLVSAAPHARLLMAGADAILAKPFDLMDLHQLLDHYLAADLSCRPTKANAASPQSSPLHVPVAGGSLPTS